MQLAREGIATPQIQAVAEKELRPVEFIRERVADGRVVIPANIQHKNLVPMGIGRELLTKINANIGNSAMSSCPQAEKRKLEQALRYGADTVMDLSSGGDIDRIRTSIIEASPVPVGTVPVYEVVAKYGAEDFDGDVIVSTILSQAKQGVDYMTIHPGLLRRHVPAAMKRVLGIVSRGGSLIARWMQRHNQENPFYTRFDEILEICLEYDVTLSLGDGLRPGCLADASDEAQFAELDTLGELVRRCRKAGLHTALDTAGSIPLRLSASVIDEADLLLLDIKALDDALCRELTGAGNRNTLDTLDFCEKNGKAVWIRHVLVPGWTLERERLTGLAGYLKTFSCIQRIDLLPFHKMGEYKWKELGQESPLAATPEPTREEIQEAEALFSFLPPRA